MKNDLILSAIINFLVPIIFLYGLFFLADFFENGFFAFIYSAVLFISAFMIYLIKSPSFAGKFSASRLELVYFFAMLSLIAYLVAILLSITDLLVI